ncbi:hypothetical protein [Rathayibacter soli]|uniref:hypothetical protein n=1 Tax=Rathayibacter soli TaxID=3144168 RepID=UPI0027E50047|nr:hypothetical protein [Glaciibacter superstes]
MRNSTGYGTSDLIDRFMKYLRTVTPSGTRNHIEPPLLPSDSGWDARIRWIIATQPVELGVEVKLSAGVIEVDQLPIPGPGVTPVLIAPFIPARKQQLLEQAGWSYWDTTGNVMIRHAGPVVFVRQQGAMKDPLPDVKPVARLRSLKGQAASEVMVGLLANGGQAGSIRDFARQNNLPVSTVSRVVSLLREENYLQPTGGGPIVIADRLAAAQRWAEDYSFGKTFNAKRYFSLSGPELALQRITGAAVPYAITGVRTAREWLRDRGRIASLPATELWIYTTDLAALQRAADLAPDRRDGNIRVAECEFLNRGEHTRTADGLRYVTPWRAVGDLLSATGRLAGVGEDLARDLIEDQGMSNG